MGLGYTFGRIVILTPSHVGRQPDRDVSYAIFDSYTLKITIFIVLIQFCVQTESDQSRCKSSKRCIV